MPIIRMDVPEGLTRDQKAALRAKVHQAIAKTWANEHIYVAIREMFSEPGERLVIVTVDLRPGRGREEERGMALNALLLQALSETIGARQEDLVLLIRETPWHGFIAQGERLRDLELITPELEAVPAASG